jgi:menaquinone-specific isochorismate synthase
MTPSPGGRRLATVTIPAPDLHPEPFLSHAGGEPRGFWARRNRWVAHRGVATEIRCQGIRSADRFEEVRELASELAREPILPPGAARAPEVRLYGGFSFRADHDDEGVWSAFPSALFHVPRFELEGRASGDAWLRARALVGPDDAESVLTRLRRDAEALRAELVATSDTSVRPQAGLTGRPTATERAAWESAVDEALSAIREGRITKAVLARTLDVELDGEVDPAVVLAHLWDANRGSHVFLFEPEPGNALLGAAPETVATLRDGVFHATAVAGSIRRGDSAAEQAELAARLLASKKDRAEQRIALDDMVARLETVAHQIRTDPEPHVLALPRIQHLETTIRASVPVGTGVLDLLRLLHPTPAVCGLPRDAALTFLGEEEPFERGWYAGPVGWFDAEGNGVFAPALRTAVAGGRTWRLFAGAGIVEGSVPALEWEETAIKFEPVLRALSASGVRLDPEAPRAPARVADGRSGVSSGVEGSYLDGAGDP